MGAARGHELAEVVGVTAGVRTTTGAPPFAVSAAATANPSVSGSCTSSRTTSGASSRAAGGRSIRRSASPTTSIPLELEQRSRSRPEARMVVDDENGRHQQNRRQATAAGEIRLATLRERPRKRLGNLGLSGDAANRARGLAVGLVQRALGRPSPALAAGGRLAEPADRPRRRRAGSAPTQSR